MSERIAEDIKIYASGSVYKLELRFHAKNACMAIAKFGMIIKMFGNHRSFCHLPLGTLSYGPSFHKPASG